MHPPRHPTFTLTIHKHHHHHHRLLLLPITTRRPLSTRIPPPTLLKIHNIPAPHLGHIRVLSLNNPLTRNALSRSLLAELSREIDVLKREGEEDEAKRIRGGGIGIGEGIGEGRTRVLILASEVDGCFCSGADLKERKGMTGEETTTFLTHLRSTLSTLSTLPIPTISALSSHAHGGGLELALSTTFRLASSTAQLSLPETRLGIIPGAGGTYRLAKLIGKRRALEIILTGRRVSGVEAGGMGICERVVDVDVDVGGDGWEGGREWKREVREKVFTAAVEMAREICEGAPRSVGAAMRAVGEGTAEGEGREYEGVVGTGDRDEALRAFGEKRRAVFRGR